jgi:hypothetical protein
MAKLSHSRFDTLSYYQYLNNQNALDINQLGKYHHRYNFSRKFRSIVKIFQLLHQHSARRKSVRDTATGTYDKDIRHYFFSPLLSPFSVFIATFIAVLSPIFDFITDLSPFFNFIAIQNFLL